MHDLISGLYAAAIGEASWEDSLDGIRRSVGADALLLGAGDVRDLEDVSLWTSGADASGHRDAGYTDAESWNPEINPCVAAGLNVAIGKSHDSRSLVPDRVRAESEFLNATMLTTGFTAHRLYVPLREGTYVSGGFISRSRGREFEPDAAAVFDSVLPDLGRALRLRETLSRHRAVERSLSALLDRLDTAVFLVDSGLSVVFLNARAEEVARRGDGIRMIRSRLCVPLAAESALLRIIADLALGDRPMSGTASVPIRRPGEPSRYLLRVYPSVSLASIPGRSRSAALVLVETLAREPSLPDVAELQVAFDLTEREAALARLVPTGKTRRDIGAVLGISENTVKTQLGAVLEKTGTRNMRELAVLLLMLGRR